MKYHKINSVFKRDQVTHKFLFNEFSCPEFQYLKDLPWIGTEKIDGTNIRIYSDGSIGGRTDNAQIPSVLLPKLEEVRDKLVESELPQSTILYGEGYGPKIQSGGHYTQEHSFVLFDVNINGNFQSRENVENIACKLNLRIVPVLGVFSLVDWVDLIKEQKFRDSVLHSGARNEGVVLHPLIELQSRVGNRIITKLKYRDFT